MKDFTYQNLKGRDFTNQNLINADFSYADIRGAKFNSAILESAKFVSAKAGLEKQWIIIQLLVSSFTVAILAFATAAVNGIFNAGFFADGLTSSYGRFAFSRGTAACLSYGTVFALSIFQGLTVRLLTLVSTILAIACMLVSILAVLVAFIGVTEHGDFVNLLLSGAFGGAVAAAGSIVGVGLFSIAIAWTVLAVNNLPLSILSTTLWATLGTLIGATVGASASEFAFEGAAAGNRDVVEFNTIAGTFMLAAIMVALHIIIGFHIVRRIKSEDKRFILVKKIAVVFSTIGGTSFFKADLTNADFTTASLGNTNFSDSILTHVCWKSSSMLDFSNFDHPTLQSSPVRQLLVTHNGCGKSYKYLTLTGANLS